MYSTNINYLLAIAILRVLLLSKALIPIKNPSVGQLCLAPYQNDDNLYRGRIVELNMNSVLVHYLDYGNCDIVLRTSIKELPLKFQDYPAQVFATFQRLSHLIFFFL